MDEDGYVWYEGRADDVIIAAGYRIGPFEVESACLEHPAVAEAAAVASPDERRGKVVKAFVVLADGHEPSDELADEIKAFVRDAALAPTPTRAGSSSSTDLPKTLTGKIRRIELARAASTTSSCVFGETLGKTLATLPSPSDQERRPAARPRTPRGTSTSQPRCRRSRRPRAARSRPAG